MQTIRIPLVTQLPRRGWLVVLVILLALFAWGLTAGDHGVWRLQQLHQRQAHLQQQISRLRQENERLRSRIQALRHNPSYIERLARQQLGLVRPGEVVYRLHDPVPEGKR